MLTFLALEIEPRAFCVSSQCSTSDLYAWPTKTAQRALGFDSKQKKSIIIIIYITIVIYYYNTRGKHLTQEELLSPASSSFKSKEALPMPLKTRVYLVYIWVMGHKDRQNKSI